MGSRGPQGLVNGDTRYKKKDTGYTMICSCGRVSGEKSELVGKERWLELFKCEVCLKNPMTGTGKAGFDYWRRL